MCATCGCEGGTATVEPSDHHHESHDHGHDHAHGPAHDQDHGQDHDHGHDTVTLEQHVLAKNDRLAAENRHTLLDLHACAVNLMSSPGAGKTTLLERTVRELADRLPVSVVEGDQETPMDAERLRATGCRTVQVNTGSGCHLDAEMFARSLHVLDPQPGSVVFVENVGNLVCPALFDLGESSRVVLASTTEGEDKPLKYPHMFRSADLVLLTKTDLLPYLDFDTGRFTDHLRRVNQQAGQLLCSATTGRGLSSWLAWIEALLPALVHAPAADEGK